MFISILILIQSVLSPYDANELLRKMHDRYLQEDSYQLDVSYKLQKLEGFEVVDTVNTVILKKGKSVFQEIGQTETIIGEEYVLAINHIAKHIYFNNQQKNFIEKFPFMKELSLKTLQNATEINLEEGSIYNKLTISFSEYIIEKVLIKYNNSSMLIDEIKYNLNEQHPMIHFEGKGVLTLRFELSELSRSGIDRFNKEQYLEKSDVKGYVPAKGLEEYKVVIDTVTTK